MTSFGTEKIQIKELEFSHMVTLKLNYSIFIIQTSNMFCHYLFTMKKLILSAIMLTGVVAFAQETPKKTTKEAVKSAASSVDAEKKAEAPKVTEVKQEANVAKKAETTTTKTAEVAQPAAPAVKTAKKQE